MKKGYTVSGRVNEKYISFAKGKYRVDIYDEETKRTEYIGRYDDVQTAVIARDEVLTGVVPMPKSTSKLKDKKKYANISVNEDFKEELKKYCQLKGVTMKDFVEETLGKYIDDDNAKENNLDEDEEDEYHNYEFYLDEEFPEY